MNIFSITKQHKIKQSLFLIALFVTMGGGNAEPNSNCMMACNGNYDSWVVSRTNLKSNNQSKNSNCITMCSEPGNIALWAKKKGAAADKTSYGHRRSSNAFPKMGLE